MNSGLQPELESKRIEKAQTRKLLYQLIATTLILWALLIFHRLHPSPLIRWALLATILPYGFLIYRLAQRARNLKSILPPGMESKRIAIAKTHNRFLLTLMLSVFAGWFVVALTASHQRFVFWAALFVSALVIGWGIYYVIQRDNALCQKLGYICPHCHKPLYEARANTYLTGLCPKCKRSVVPDSLASRAAAN